MPKCSEVMTREPAFCEPGDRVRDVASTMKQQDVGSIPVVESRDSRRLIGIVTDRDIVMKVVAGGGDLDRATVRDAMTNQPTACREDEDVTRAVSTMADRQVRRVPVVDASGRLMGIIAQADVATRVHEDQRTGQMVEAISEPAHGKH